ncbi:MAG: hypothetical protein ACRC2H_07280, partial [Silanimonas sp.]
FAGVGAVVDGQCAQAAALDDEGRQVSERATAPDEVDQHLQVVDPVAAAEWLEALLDGWAALSSR